MTDYAELQARLLSCAMNEVIGEAPDGSPACQNVSAFVVRAIRPSVAGGPRTDMGVFGVCREHKYEWALLMDAFGYTQGMLVEWSAIGELFKDLETMGYLKYVDVADAS
jgi:hypothetical protein